MNDINDNAKTNDDIASVTRMLTASLQKVFLTEENYRKATSICYALTDRKAYLFLAMISAVTYYEDEKKFCGEMIKTGCLHVYFVDPHRMKIEHGGSCVFNLANCSGTGKRQSFWKTRVLYTWASIWRV